MVVEFFLELDSLRDARRHDIRRHCVRRRQPVVLYAPAPALATCFANSFSLVVRAVALLQSPPQTE